MVPLYADVNVTARFKLSVLPFSATEVPATLTEHWLFCNVVPLPSTAPLAALAASFSRYNVLPDRFVIHRAGVRRRIIRTPLNTAHTVARFNAPAESEYCSANVCVSPEPELGVTASAVTLTAAVPIVQVPRFCQPVLAPALSDAHKYTLFVPL